MFVISESVPAAGSNPILRGMRTQQSKFAVVTPYHNEHVDELLTAHRSVLSQFPVVNHIMVADGCPNAAVGTWACQHIVLPSAHGDAGNFARGIGALHAFQSGAEFVCFLDADNWLEANHVSSLHDAITRYRSDIAVSRRALIRLDGSVLDPLDPESDGFRFADTGTVMLSRAAIDIASLWATLPTELWGAGDQFIWAAINNRGLKISRTEIPTVNYKTKWAVHYLGRNEEPPHGTVDLMAVKKSEHHWQGMSEMDRRRIILGHA
jgi:hypothetical protein